jgi:holo-[acyl-carrier protein] synthase
VDPAGRVREWRRLCAGADRAHGLGLAVNAGHGINYVNVTEVRALPHLHECNIGHSIISRALYLGPRGGGGGDAPPAQRRAPPMNLDLVPGGVLVGLGSDLVDVDRIRGVWDRQGERFLERVFTAEERQYCLGMKFPHKHLAARFAAKEAVCKAFSTGIGPYLSWKSVSVYHGERMDPRVRLDEKVRPCCAPPGPRMCS